MKPILISSLNINKIHKNFDEQLKRFTHVEADNNTCSFEINFVLDHDYGMWLIIHVYEKPLYNEIEYQEPLIGVLNLWC